MSDAGDGNQLGTTRPPRRLDAELFSTPAPRRSRLGDVVGILWVMAAGVLVLLPALRHGTSLGPYDILNTRGITSVRGVTLEQIHNFVTGDQIRLFIPWTNEVWTQVHHGLLPLWNPYSALGAPLAFNWESAPLSIPVLIGYLFPVHLSFTVQIIVTVLIAGTGVYTLGRVLRLSPLACMMAATVFELSGPFIGWLGWPNSSVMAWGGWMLSAVVLILRGRRRALSIVLLAVVLACAAYAGDPEEVLIVLGMAPAVFVLLILLMRSKWTRGTGRLLRPLVDLAVGYGAGVALAAPLILPGLQLASKSNRTAVGATNGPKNLPLGNALHLLFQGFDGLPLKNSQWFGFSNYVETAMYVGVIAVVLAVMAVAFAWRRPEVRALTGIVAVMAIVVFVPGVISVLDKEILSTYWVFAMQPMVLGIAVLSGIGVDVVIRSHQDLRLTKWLAISFASAAVFLVLVGILTVSALSSSQARIREHSFIWPFIEVAVGLLVAAALFKLAARRRPGRRSASGLGSVAAFVLLACETGFLIAAGAPLFSSTSTYLKPTPTIVALQRAVGDAVVGFGTTCLPPPRVGIEENVNIVYGIREISVYDPMTPHAYWALPWQQETGFSGGKADASNFCPVFPTATLARRFGVGYVLDFPGFAGPKGSVFVKRIGGEDLYKIPGASAAVLLSMASGRNSPSLDATGSPVPVTHPIPSVWHMVTNAPTPALLRMHLTNVPGWHATVNGRPLKLVAYDQVMLQAQLPAGHDVVELHYWPDRFNEGLVLAFGAVVVLIFMLGVAAGRSRSSARQRRASARAPQSDPATAPSPG